MTEAEPNILVIDDDDVIAEALAVLFEDAGYRTRRATTSRDALALASAELPDLAVVDVRLGQECGLDILPLLKRMHPRMAVIVLTAVPTREVMSLALERGADSFATKAIEPVHLLELVASGLHGQR
jgi:two-component system response regulator RegA